MAKHLMFAAFLVGCSGGGEVVYGPDDPLAHDLSIARIHFNQGVQYAIMDRDNGLPFGQPSVIHDRPGLLRVHVDVDESRWVARDIVGVLDVYAGRGPARLTTISRVEADSAQSDLESTLNFDVPADLVHHDTRFTVTLHEVEREDGETRNIEAMFDLADQPWEGIDTGALTIRVIPIVYAADGSDRTPDVSPTVLGRMEDALIARYPAAEVRLEVADPFRWDGVLLPNSAGWSNLVTEIARQRGSADVSDDVYFYGLVSPGEDRSQYCGSGGCMLGLSARGMLDDPSTRSSVGVGWEGEAIETMVHELGHAHGRQHAPCGDADSVDPSFPHDDATLGAWGWNVVTGELYHPAGHHDMMAYCEPVWVSDYTWFHLAERMATLHERTR